MTDHLHQTFAGILGDFQHGQQVARSLSADLTPARGPRRRYDEDAEETARIRDEDHDRLLAATLAPEPRQVLALCNEAGVEAEPRCTRCGRRSVTTFCGACEREMDANEREIAGGAA